jgi:uncharacterized caspase-like protein
MRRLCLALVAAIAFLPIAAQAARQALVIGNDSYTAITPLKNARADARAIAKALESAGFKVTLALDQDRSGMNASLRRFKTGLAGGDEAVFFYAGHGVQLGGANYLLPVDMKGEDEDQIKDDAVQLQRILDDFAEQKARFSLAIVDACRDNPFKGKGRNFATRGLAPTSAASGQMIIFSAGAGQQALDRLGDADQSPNGLFTRLLLMEIDRDGQSIDRALKNVRAEVVRLAKSVGHEQVPAIYDQAIGDFYFRRTGASTTASPNLSGGATAGTAGAAVPGELDLWRSVEAGNTVADYDAYLDQYPKGAFSALAKARKAQLATTQKASPVARLDDAPVRRGAPFLEIGSHVLGQWTDGYWYPATITAKSSLIYSLAYDDGDRSELPKEKIRPIEWTVGKKISCNWKGKGRYYPGVIKTVADRLLLIHYEDGTFEEIALAKCREK